MVEKRIQIENVNIPELGSLVQFKTASYENGVIELSVTKDEINTTYKLGRTDTIPPVMVIIEIVKENRKEKNFFNEKTGRSTGTPLKVLCQWFSHQTNSFQERWFNFDVLEIFEGRSEEVELKIGEVVTLRSANYLDELVKSVTNGKSAQKEESSYKLTRIFKDMNYAPPKMLITDIEGVPDNEKSPLFNKSNGERIREASDTKVKCMWYDYKNGKYSEAFFKKEALQKAIKVSPDEVVLQKIITTFSQDK